MAVEESTVYRLVVRRRTRGGPETVFRSDPYPTPAAAGGLLGSYRRAAFRGVEIIEAHIEQGEITWKKVEE